MGSYKCGQIAGISQKKRENNNHQEPEQKYRLRMVTNGSGVAGCGLSGADTSFMGSKTVGDHFRRNGRIDRQT